MASRSRGDRTLGLVLSGGGARGAFQVGVYERMLEDARFARGPVILSGTSAGAINAAGFLSGPGQYAAALKAARDFALATDMERAAPAFAQQVREEVRALEDEIARLASAVAPA